MNTRNVRRRSTNSTTTRQLRRYHKRYASGLIICATAPGCPNSTLGRGVRNTQDARRASKGRGNRRMEGSTRNDEGSLFNPFCRYIMRVSSFSRTQRSGTSSSRGRRRVNGNNEMRIGLFPTRLRRGPSSTYGRRTNSSRGRRSNSIRRISTLMRTSYGSTNRHQGRDHRRG